MNKSRKQQSGIQGNIRQIIFLKLVYAHFIHSGQKELTVSKTAVTESKTSKEYWASGQVLGLCIATDLEKYNFSAIGKGLCSNGNGSSGLWKWVCSPAPSKEGKKSLVVIHSAQG